MAIPQNGKGQTNEKVISQSPRKMEVVLITTYPNGKKTSVTKHYRANSEGKWSDRVQVTGGRHAQREDGKPKVWTARGARPGQHRGQRRAA